MKVFACPGVKHFLDTWPNLISGTACELEEEATIASTFSEANMQTAFMSIAARQKEVETMPHVQTAQLNVLTHRTEPLSIMQTIGCGCAGFTSAGHLRLDFGEGGRTSGGPQIAPHPITAVSAVHTLWTPCDLGQR